ncbi:MAG: DUF262 domain-containing protein [Candidatus Contendobacter sp.]|nr:MAG: DUF262 domain-containing protein [Candidatus Contendobacter sp.]
MKIIHSNQFESIYNLLTDQATIFIIPSFQRPYAWEESQVKDLWQDMIKASSLNGGHYLSTFHLIEINSSELLNNQSVFLDFQGNDDLNKLQSAFQKDGVLQDHYYKPIQLHMVVDGQQRLTSLFLLGHIFAASKNLNVSNLFYVTLRDSVTTVPRLIQHPGDDHGFFARLVNQLTLPTPSFSVLTTKSQSQMRMLDNAKRMMDWGHKNLKALGFLNSQDFKISIIQLDAHFGLTSFMTLNDRGKSLTNLEKLKSLLLQYAVDVSNIPLTRQLHTEFGKLYKTLDSCVFCNLFNNGKDGDDQLVRLLSCYLRMATDRDAIWQSAEAAYDNFFRAELQNAAGNPVNVTALITNWLKDIKEVVEQLQQLENYLSGRLGAGVPSLHYTHCSVNDDYRVTLLSLRLQPHFLALLLKFRALYGREWHQSFPITALFNPALVQPIQTAILDIQSRSQNQPKALTDLLDKLSRYDWVPRTKISMLEVIERMQILNWNMSSRWNANFVNYCRSTFSKSVNDFIQQWSTWCGAKDFVENILSGFNETNLKFLLKEQERSLCGHLHFSLTSNISSTGLELEHVFAQNIDSDPHFNALGGFSAFGIIDKDDFNQNVLWRSGNLVWLSESANAALGNKTPDIKAGDYCSCPGHPAGTHQNVCSDINIVRKLGGELSSLGVHYSAYRLYIEARSVELAIFGLNRFG